MMSHKKILAAAVAMVVGGSALSAWAGTGNTTFNVTTTVVNDCTIGSTNIAFANYDPTSATVLTATGAVTARCTKGDSVSVALNQGANPGAGSTAAVPVRQMANGTNLLPYHIYIAATGTTEWGTGTIGTNEPAAQTAASVATALSFTTYGSLPAGADVPAGSYSDSVIATVTF
jgi:spore coat protein U-like protein